MVAHLHTYICKTLVVMMWQVWTEPYSRTIYTDLSSTSKILGSLNTQWEAESYYCTNTRTYTANCFCFNKVHSLLDSCRVLLHAEITPLRGFNDYLQLNSVGRVQ